MEFPELRGLKQETQSQTQERSAEASAFAVHLQKESRTEGVIRQRSERREGHCLLTPHLFMDGRLKREVQYCLQKMPAFFYGTAFFCIAPLLFPLKHFGSEMFFFMRPDQEEKVPGMSFMCYPAYGRRAEKREKSCLLLYFP